MAKNIVPLKELCNNFKKDIVDGPFGANLKREHYKLSGIPVLKIQNIKSFKITLKKMDYVDLDKYKELERHSYKNGDIVMTKLGNPLGESAIVENLDDGLIVADLVRIRAQKIDTKYLCYHLNSPVTSAFINSQQKGTTRPRVRIAVVRELPIYAPPISEQKRIVAILDQAFADIDKARANAEQNLKNTRELFESTLNSRLLSVCSSASTQTLSCITELIVDCEHKTAPTQEDGFPLIRTPNIGKGELLLERVKKVSKETYTQWTNRAIPQPNDLILAREAPAGNVGVIPNGELVCLGQRTVLIRPKLNIVAPHYLAFLILHPIMQKRLLAHSTGATVQHVNMKDIRALAISELPSIEQQFFDVEVLNKIKQQVVQLEKVYVEKLNKLSELKKSILQKAFTGELTNSQAMEYAE